MTEFEWRTFAPKEIDQAGRILAGAPDVGEPDDEWLEAARLVAEWRAAHAGPLHTFQANLRRRIGRRDIVARRLKRLPSIISKLVRLPRIPLSRMQDIGGCRAVVGQPYNAFKLAADLMDSRIRHEMIRYKNYIECPRPSGYRGLHLVYSYDSERTKRWQGLNIEIQIRSKLQHRWATAVESVGAFMGDGLKSNLGDANWLRFFALMSTAIAWSEESPGVPGTPTDPRELIAELRESERMLGVSERLEAFQDITRQLKDVRRISNHWVVLELNMKDHVVFATAFSPDDLEAATAYYLDREVESRSKPDQETVLVSTSSLSALRRAYPNYFADLTDFRRVLDQTLAGR